MSNQKGIARLSPKQRGTIMATTDGIYLWYFGGGTDPEMYHAAESREDAIAQGWLSYPEGDFTICEADKAVPSFDVMPADWILDRYEECNEECWGEDGAEISATSKQQRELEKILADALQMWMERHDLKGRVWSLGHTRAEEYFPRNRQIDGEER